MSTAQLREAGVGKHRVRRWVSDGLLHRVHHGVYAVGHRAPSVLGAYKTAVLACGEGAVLSHHAAAHLLRLTRRRPSRPEVTVPTLAGRSRPGITIHRVRSLHPLDSSIFEGIPIATVPRVLLDLAPSTRQQELTRMCHEAWVQHDTGPREVEACIARNPHKKGISTLRDALASDATLSELEDGFLVLLDEHGLPPPAHEHRPPWRQGRLPLARPPAHRRAAELPLPRHAPRVRTGHRTPQKLGPCRLQLRRRLRTPRTDDRRAACADRRAPQRSFTASSPSPRPSP